MVAKSKNAKDITNSVYIGPGYWIYGHKKARNANTYQKKVEFVNFLNELSVNFPCHVCRSHIKEYLKSHSTEPYWNIKDAKTKMDIGFTKYFWEFHNVVNKRLNKPIMDWDTMMGLYAEDDDNAVCESDCGQ